MLTIFNVNFLKFYFLKTLELTWYCHNNEKRVFKRLYFFIFFFFISKKNKSFKQSTFIYFLKSFFCFLIFLKFFFNKIQKWKIWKKQNKLLKELKKKLFHLSYENSKHIYFQKNLDQKGRSFWILFF